MFGCVEVPRLLFEKAQAGQHMAVLLQRRHGEVLQSYGPYNAEVVGLKIEVNRCRSDGCMLCHSVGRLSNYHG